MRGRGVRCGDGDGVPGRRSRGRTPRNSRTHRGHRRSHRGRRGRDLCRGPAPGAAAAAGCGRAGCAPARRQRGAAVPRSAGRRAAYPLPHADLVRGRGVHGGGRARRGQWVPGQGHSRAGAGRGRARGRRGTVAAGRPRHRRAHGEAARTAPPRSSTPAPGPAGRWRAAVCSGRRTVRGSRRRTAIATAANCVPTVRAPPDPVRLPPCPDSAVQPASIGFRPSVRVVWCRTRVCSSGRGSTPSRRSRASGTCGSGRAADAQLRARTRRVAMGTGMSWRAAARSSAPPMASSSSGRPASASRCMEDFACAGKVS